MSSTPQVIWDDQPKAPPVATAPAVQWDDEQPQAKPVQPIAPQVPPAIAAQNAIARKNIAKYPENQAKPDPDYIARKNAFEAVQTEPGAPQDFQEDPEQERLIKAQQEVQNKNSMVPDAAVPALQAVQTHVNDPLDRMSAATGRFGRDVATRALVTPPTELGTVGDVNTDPPVTNQEVQERLKAVPKPLIGATRATGSVVGGMVGDPRMWPLFFAGPEASGFKTAMSAGFGTQMAVGAYQQAGELGKILDNPDVPPEDKWEAGANMILSTIMAAQAYGHPINEAVQSRVAEFHNLPPADQAQIAERLRQKAPELAAEIDQHVAAPQTQEAAPQVTWDDQTAKSERFRLPRGSSAAEVQGPVQGPNIRTVQVGDKTYAFDQRKINADGVTRAVERGELWRLTGGKTPEAATAQAEQDLRGEEPEAPKQEAQAAPAVQWDDEKPADEPTTQNLTENKGEKQESEPLLRPDPDDMGRLFQRTLEREQLDAPNPKSGQSYQEWRSENFKRGTGRLSGGGWEGATGMRFTDERLHQIFGNYIDESPSNDKMSLMPADKGAGSKPSANPQGQQAELHAQIADIISKGEHKHYGLRVPFSESWLPSSPLEVGEVAPNSYKWIDNKPTNRQLKGASVIKIKNASDIPRAMKALDIYLGDKIALLGSDTAFKGEDAGEAILPNARVLQVWGRTGGASPSEGSPAAGFLAAPSDITSRPQSGGIPASGTQVYKSQIFDGSSGDRRTESRGPDRREDIPQRKAIEQMSPEEKDAEIAQLRQDADTDKMTGTKTKGAFLRDQAQRPAKALAAIDVDGLKPVNDSKQLGGHHAGDIYLREVSRLLKEHGIDLYRTGGDEFYAPGESKEELQAKLDKAAQVIDSHDFEFELSDGSKFNVKHLGVSYGTGTDWRPGENDTFSVPDADKALYEHKQQRLAQGYRGERGEFGRRIEIRRTEPPNAEISEGEAAPEQRTAEVKPPEGIPAKGEAGRVPLDRLTLAPKEFQYKLNTNEHGVTNLLKGQKWNDDLAGVVSVWHNPADGKTYVVNGHHRVQLAKENGVRDLLVRHLNVDSAPEARATGALQNIAEGRGTPVDAAKFFRDSGITPEQLEKRGISLGEATAENGIALSRLDGFLFDKVVSGEMPQSRGAAIGRATDNPATQDAIFKLIEKAEKRGRRVSAGMVADLAIEAKRAKETTTETASLFGNSYRTENNALDKAEVSGYIRSQLAKEKRVFGAVASEDKAGVLGQVKGQSIKPGENEKISREAAQAMEVYDKLRATRGPIDDILESAATRLAKRENSGSVKSEAYKQARAEIRKALSGSDRPGTGGLPAGTEAGKETSGEADRQASVRASDLEELRRPKNKSDEPVLPGMEPHLEAEKEAKAEKQSEDLTHELTAPKESISAKTGEMERNSPLFRDTEASGQGGLFAEKKDSERGSATLASSPIPALIESTAGLIKKGSDLYHGAVDKALDYAHMGQTRPEIRKFDPDAADLATKMDAGGQYHKAVAEMIGKKVTEPLTEKFNPRDTFAERQQKNELSRARMKGFHFLADAQNREWAEENKPEDYKRWEADPKIKEALAAYKPFEEQLRSAVKQLGGKTIDADYIKRIMDFATSGVAYESPTGELKIGQPQSTRGGRDNVVSPQVDRSKSRKDAGQYYWDHGVYDFGPSFQKRWTEVMSKLDEHRLAVHAMSMGTRVAPDEPMPEKVFYNGQEFYRPDVAREIKEVQKNGVSPESKALADALGVSELPPPKNVREYSTYEPLRRGSRFESAARNLAANVLAGKEGIEGQAAEVNRMAKLRYALPKEIVEALNDAGREKEQGALAKKITQVIGPLTQFIRQQIVGLAYGVPHMANILRKVVQSHPLGALNPMGWADAFKVAFSKELKARGISGPEDPTYNMLLRNGAINEGAIPEYKHYIEGNFNPKSWEGLQEAFKTAGNAFRQGGKEGAEVTPLSAAAGLGRMAIEPLNRFSEAGHRNLFKQGGIDQRARIWLGDFLKYRYPGMKENRIAHEVNQTLGRYNRASWTDVQRGLAPFMLFPGWDYSSMAFAMKHPFNTAVAPAVLMLLANAAVNSMGGNKSDEKHDLERLHVGKYSGRANILNDNMGSHLWGWALRGAKAGLDHKNAKDVTGEMVKGLPGDVAGVTTATMNPIISTPIQLGANRIAPGRQQEIVKPGDLHKRGKFLPNKATEDYADFAARRVFPLYDRATQAGQRPSLASFAGLAGVNINEKKKKR